MVAQGFLQGDWGWSWASRGEGLGETGAGALAAGQHLPVSTEPRRLSVWSLRLGWLEHSHSIEGVGAVGQLHSVWSFKGQISSNPGRGAWPFRTLPEYITDITSDILYWLTWLQKPLRWGDIDSTSQWRRVTIFRHSLKPPRPIRRAPSVFASGRKTLSRCSLVQEQGSSTTGMKGFFLPRYQLPWAPWALTDTITAQGNQGLKRQAVSPGGRGGGDEGSFMGDPAPRLCISWLRCRSPERSLAHGHRGLWKPLCRPRGDQA